MSLIDILLLVLIASYCAYIVFAKKTNTCCGDCSKCRGCSESKKS